jgi:hypothetical protein
VVERTHVVLLAVLLSGVLAFTGGCSGRAADNTVWTSKDEARTVPAEPPLRELVRAGEFSDRRLTEASGVVASTKEPGVLWSQNDSGNAAMLFAYDSTGAPRGAVQVRDADNTDWEAIAIGPCPRGECLYIGDVGDNFATRSYVRVWRIPSPMSTARVTESATLRRIVYPGGARDVEAMWVAPDTSVWFATKRPEGDAKGRPRPSRLYRVPASAWASGSTTTATAELVDSLPIVPRASVSRDWVTDASLSSVMPDGRRRLAILTYGSVYVFDADPFTGRPRAPLASCAVPPGLRQAEGISWLPDGRLMLANEGRGASLYRGRCP